MMRFTFLLLICLVFSGPSFAQTAQKDAFRSTPYPLPRFVSLKSSKVYARTGPGKQYPVRYQYNRKSLPVEITLEYEGWRKIRDYHGDEAWVHKTLLSGKRTAIIEVDTTFQKRPSEESKTTARLQKGAIVAVEECDKTWCQVRAGGYEGWLPQRKLWGVYHKEIID